MVSLLPIGAERLCLAAAGSTLMVARTLIVCKPPPLGKGELKQILSFIWSLKWKWKLRRAAKMGARISRRWMRAACVRELAARLQVAGASRSFQPAGQPTNMAPKQRPAAKLKQLAAATGHDRLCGQLRANSVGQTIGSHESGRPVHRPDFPPPNSKAHSNARAKHCARFECESSHRHYTSYLVRAPTWAGRVAGADRPQQAGRRAAWLAGLLALLAGWLAGWPSGWPAGRAAEEQPARRRKSERQLMSARGRIWQRNSSSAGRPLAASSPVGRRTMSRQLD